MLQSHSATCIGDRLGNIQNQISAVEEADLIDRVKEKFDLWGIGKVEGITAVSRFELDRSLPPSGILNASECKTLARLEKDNIQSEGSKGSWERLVVILKATRLCNLRCVYCHAWRDGPGQVMSFEIAAQTMRSILAVYKPKSIDFVWHGGEVTTLPTSFVRKVLWLQARYAWEGQIVRNSIQTNGYAISKAWISLLVERGFSVGVSVDGDPLLHDSTRRSVNGSPTFSCVVEGMAQLVKSGISVGALVVVTTDTIRRGPDKLMSSLVAAGVTSAALLNEIPSINNRNPVSGENYVPFSEFVEFLRATFKAWRESYQQKIRVRELDAYINALRGGQPMTCTISGNCMGGFLTIDPDGSVHSCDKYVGSQAHRFGEIGKEITNWGSQSLNLIGAHAEAEADTADMHMCKYYNACRGGCPHDNMLTRRMAGAVSDCCGLKPLFEDIEQSLKELAQ